MTRWRVLLAAASAIGLASPAGTQPARATAEFSVGTVLGATGGDYFRRTGGAFTAFLGARTVGNNSSRNQVFGASLSLVGDPGSGDDYAVAPDGGCLAKFPLLFGLGMEGGWTAGDQFTGTLRLGLGGYWNIKVDGGRAIGVQAQADVAAAPIALVLRGIALPNLHGHTLLIAILTLGLRWN